MIVGDLSTFAIESGLTYAYSRLSFRALGFFTIYVGGRCFGVREPEATMLANSFDEVRARISRRGVHTAPFATSGDASAIASAFRTAFYHNDELNCDLLDMRPSDFRELIISNHLVWAPDGDAAFDDGSKVLHFDVGDRVRLIAYTLEPAGDDYRPDPNSLKDQWLDAGIFYGVLRNWADSFEREWLAATKVSE